MPEPELNEKPSKSKILIKILNIFFILILCFRRLDEAVKDVTEAVRLTESNKEIRKVLIKIREEMIAESNAILMGTSNYCSVANAKADLRKLKQLATSVDTLSDEANLMTSSMLSESGYSSNI